MWSANFNVTEGGGVAVVKRWQVSSRPQRVKLAGKNKGKLGETEKRIVITLA